MGCREPHGDAAKAAGTDSDRKPTGESALEMPFYVGTYTDGESEGIYKYVLSADGSLKNIGLAGRAENPSFLAFSPDRKQLLAVNEVSNSEAQGYVSSFKMDRDTLLLLDQKPSGGAHPCHISVNADGYIVVANYSGGNMGLLRWQPNGTLSELLDVQQHKGSGTHPRQEGPHAHSGWFTPEGGIIAVDLGTNQLWFSKIDTVAHKFASGMQNTLSMEPGAGPRHLALHPKNSGIYVLNELSSSVSFLKKNKNGGQPYEIVQTLSTLPEGYLDANTCADIHISGDGKFVYASNRGHNSIAIYSVNEDSGELQLLGYELTRGQTPRNFNLSPNGRFLLVANQTTNSISSFQRDPLTGLLTFMDQTEAFAPVCILFEPSIGN
jgi:6-phosphogluconolactonase